MRLAEWRKQQGWKQDRLAAELDSSQPFVSEIERAVDPKIPGRNLMVRIWRLTRGAVAPNDFYDLPPIGQLKLPMEAALPSLFDQTPVAPEPERLVA